jgi:hypothetical protein
VVRAALDKTENERAHIILDNFSILLKSSRAERNLKRAFGPASSLSRSRIVRTSSSLRSVAVHFVAFAAAAVAQSDEMRTWRDSTGKRSIQAELLEVTDSEVKLRRHDGVTALVPIAKLSVADQNFVSVRRSASREGAPKEKSRVEANLKSLQADNSALREANKSLSDRITALEAQLRAITQLVEQGAKSPEREVRPEVLISDARPINAIPSIYLGADAHWISHTSADGSLLTLDDGSIWQVATPDRRLTTRWLPMEDVVLAKNKSGLEPYALLNKDNGGKAEVKPFSK